MYRLKLHVIPDSGSVEYCDIGGAYVVCYVPASSAEIAIQKATEYVSSEKWVVLQIEETPTQIKEDQESISREEQDHLQEAREEGGCYIFHSYPAGHDEEDTVH